MGKGEEDEAKGWKGLMGVGGEGGGRRRDEEMGVD